MWKNNNKSNNRNTILLVDNGEVGFGPDASENVLGCSVYHQLNVRRDF